MHTVLIVEDDPNTGTRFAEIVKAQPTLELIGLVTTVAEAAQQLNDTPPDILLCDLGLPDGSGIDIILHSQRISHPVEVLVITLFDDEQHVIGSIEAGASGYLLKDGYETDIVQSILDVIQGGSPISPSIARYLLRRFQRPEKSAQVNQTLVETEQLPINNIDQLPYLTSKENEVLDFLSKGFTYSEISKLLGTSSHTISSHTKHIYKKLEVRSRAEAVFEAASLGLLNLGKYET